MNDQSTCGVDPSYRGPLFVENCGRRRVKQPLCTLSALLSSLRGVRNTEIDAKASAKMKFLNRLEVNATYRDSSRVRARKRCDPFGATTAPRRALRASQQCRGDLHTQESKGRCEGERWCTAGVGKKQIELHQMYSPLHHRQRLNTVKPTELRFQKVRHNSRRGPAATLTF